MARKNTTKETIINELQGQLMEDMKKAGVEVEPYAIAIRITAETLYEREQAYKEYVEDGSRQLNDKHNANPYAVRLASWNSQSRACLGMLKLTPPRPTPGAEEMEIQEETEAEA